MAVLTQAAGSKLVGPTVVAAAEFVHVSKSYSSFLHWRTIPAVRDVSFRIEPGEVFGLLGPNRSGKTTLVKILLSLCRPGSGAVLRLGQPAANRATLGQIGYVHENQAFPRYLTAAALLEYYGALSFLPYELLRERIPNLLQRFGLADRGNEPISCFSKGMLQRLAMAQALINAPRLLVLDEPTEGLDLEGRQLLHEAAAEVRGRGGSVLLISHALGEVAELCDRVGVLVNGRLIHVGRVEDLLESPSEATPRSLEQALKELYAKPLS
jgi:ABC-2 type transport system ATP-binding protein